MTIPSRGLALDTLADLDTPDWLFRHSTAVAEVAAFLADRMRGRGLEIPADLAETAALLHDVDKTPPVRHLRASLGHGHGSAAWLVERGWDELAPAVENHPADRLANDAWFRDWLATASPAAKIVAYADKRATFDVIPMVERFDEWRERHPERAGAITRGETLAQELEADVCAAAGIAPADVRRLRWVGLPVKR